MKRVLWWWHLGNRIWYGYTLAESFYSASENTTMILRQIYEMSGVYDLRKPTSYTQHVNFFHKLRLYLRYCLEFHHLQSILASNKFQQIHSLLSFYRVHRTKSPLNQKEMTNFYIVCPLKCTRMKSRLNLVWVNYVDLGSHLIFSILHKILILWCRWLMADNSFNLWCCVHSDRPAGYCIRKNTTTM